MASKLKSGMQVHAARCGPRGARTPDDGSEPSLEVAGPPPFNEKVDAYWLQGVSPYVEIAVLPTGLGTFEMARHCIEVSLSLSPITYLTSFKRLVLHFLLCWHI